MAEEPLLEQSEPMLFVNPADVHMADVKAAAAQHGATVVASAVVPRGKAFSAPHGFPRLRKTHPCTPDE